MSDVQVFTVAEAIRLIERTVQPLLEQYHNKAATIGGHPDTRQIRSYYTGGAQFGIDVLAALSAAFRGEPVPELSEPASPRRVPANRGHHVPGRAQ